MSHQQLLHGEAWVRGARLGIPFWRSRNGPFPRCCWFAVGSAVTFGVLEQPSTHQTAPHFLQKKENVLLWIVVQDNMMVDDGSLMMIYDF